MINVKFYFAMFYQVPVDTFPCQVQPGKNERFALRRTVVPTAGTCSVTVGAARTFRPDVVLLPHTVHLIRNICGFRHIKDRQPYQTVLDTCVHFLVSESPRHVCALPRVRQSSTRVCTSLQFSTQSFSSNSRNFYSKEQFLFLKIGKYLSLSTGIYIKDIVRQDTYCGRKGLCLSRP